MKKIALIIAALAFAGSTFAADAPTKPVHVVKHAKHPVAKPVAKMQPAAPAVAVPIKK